MARDLVLFGDGGLTEIVARYAIEEDAYNVVAFTVDEAYLTKKTLLGRPVVAFEQAIELYPDSLLLVAVTFQARSHRFLGKEKSEQGVALGFELARFVSKRASVAPDVRWGKGVIVSPNAILEPGVVLGDGVIVRSGVYVGHHCQIGNYSYLAPRAAMSGYVTVEPHAFVGLNATIRDRVTIGHSALIGCGVVVNGDVAPKTVLKASDPLTLPVSRDGIKP